MRSKLFYLSLVTAIGLMAAPAARAQRIVYCDGCRREIHLSRADMDDRIERARERADQARERAQERAQERAVTLRERNIDRDRERAEQARERAEQARERARDRADRDVTRSRVYRNRW